MAITSPSSPTGASAPRRRAPRLDLQTPVAVAVPEVCTRWPRWPCQRFVRGGPVAVPRRPCPGGRARGLYAVAVRGGRARGLYCRGGRGGRARGLYAVAAVAVPRRPCQRFVRGGRARWPCQRFVRGGLYGKQATLPAP
jgi:hypothetical protein